MEELKQKMDLILESQIAVQTSVIKLNHKVDALDEKFEKKFEETNQRIDALDEKFERKFEETNQRITGLQEDLKVELKDISDMFNTVFEHIPA